MALTFKIADQPWEIEQLHRLNYRTFVEEIPQHRPNEAGVLVDRFHADNVYFVALHGRAVVGMVALRCRRPFSLDEKVPGLDAHLPPDRRRIAEVRLLAADPAHRGGRVFVGLLGVAGRYLVSNGFDLAIASGTTRQARLYRHLGWTPFGPLVGTPGAMYQPMYQTRERFEETARAIALSLSEVDDGDERDDNAEDDRPATAVGFMPGPVDVGDAVRRAMAAPAVSHRSERFAADFRETRRRLCELVNAPHVQILSGSGTLANDVVAAQLSLIGGRGLILSNGEFGERLIDHARRFGLIFDVVRQPWGAAFDAATVEGAVTLAGDATWLWAVHCETSTGVLNGLPAMKDSCARRGLRLCVDCVSSLGTVPVDLRGIDFASGVSGKGLRSVAGLSFVFHAREIAPAPRLPRYLDLGQYAAATNGVPYTIGSNILYALKAAVEDLRPAERFTEVADLSRRVRAAVSRMGLTIVADEAHVSPAVITLALPESLQAEHVGDAMAAAGHLLAYRSDYLLDRNWLQVCLMGHYRGRCVERMLRALRREVSEPSPTPTQRAAKAHGTCSVGSSPVRRA